MSARGGLEYSIAAEHADDGYRMNLLKAFRALTGRIPVFARHRCNLCGHRVARFIPYRIGSAALPGLMRAVDFTGSDLDNFECPWCGATDRERHLVMYMESAGLMDGLGGKEILHFAPEARLSRLIAAKEPVRYVKADLYPTGPDVQAVDMHDIPFDDGAFDLVIANHVLEHVADDRQALRELRRVLRPGGHAVLQTPFSRKLQSTWSDDGFDDEESRLQAYGQEDHVRLFGRDIVSRFSESGMISRVQEHREAVPGIDARVYGVNVHEPFFLFERPG